jgi:type 1 glutamine amidotransferase
VTEKPSADLNREKLAAYDVLVLKDNPTGAGSAWTPENRQAVAAVVKEGTGLVVLHQASAGFNDDSTGSREYRRMIAGGRRGGAKTDQPRDLSVTIQKNHPVTRGIGSFRQPADKLVRSPQITEGSQVLATVFDGREQDEPVVWVNHYGNGRVVHNLLGHDTASMKSDGFAKLLIGCVEWAGEKGFRMIFDGKTLDGWEGNLRYWSVKNGAIVGTNPSWKPMVVHDFLCTVEDFDDFELRIEAKVIGQRNSGIVVRTVKQRYQYPIAGYEVDMGVMRWGWIFEEGGPRQILNRDVQKELQPKIQAALKQGDFNDVVVRCIDNRIDAWINGVPFGFTETKQDVAQRLRKGKIGLQLHDGKPQVVYFRNIRVKELRRD